MKFYFRLHIEILIQNINIKIVIFLLCLSAVKFPSVLDLLYTKKLQQIPNRILIGLRLLNTNKILVLKFNSLQCVRLLPRTIFNSQHQTTLVITYIIFGIPYFQGWDNYIQISNK